LVYPILIYTFVQIITKMSTIYGSLGKQIVISPKTLVNVEGGIAKVEMTVNGHLVELTMPEQAWVALKNGKPMFSQTLKEFNSKIINHRKK